MRVLRFRMAAVKNSMKRPLARSPRARIITGSVSSPAQTSAGGGTISSVSRIGCFGKASEPSPFFHSDLAHKAEADDVLQTRGQGQGASATMPLRPLRPWPQRVISGYQFETLNLLSSQYEGREMKCIQRS